MRYTSIWFSVMSRERGKFFSCLTDLLAIIKNSNESTVMGWLRAKLSFKLLRTVNICRFQRKKL